MATLTKPPKPPMRETVGSDRGAVTLPGSTGRRSSQDGAPGTRPAPAPPASAAPSLKAAGSIRRIASAPELQKAAPVPAQAGHGASWSDPTDAKPAALNLYIARRPFQEWGGGVMTRLPEPMSSVVQDMGICHYMAMVEDTQTGRKVMYDFGPAGGRETTLEVQKVVDPLTGEVKTGAPGEIREEVLHELPDKAMFVGTVHGWSLDDIRRHNAEQPTVYKLNENDCRHYANNLLHAMTGEHGASVRLLDWTYEQRSKEEKVKWIKDVLNLDALPDLEPEPAYKVATTPGGTHVHMAMAATTLSVTMCASPRTAPAARGKNAGINPAARMLLPLLASLPAADAPLVKLGQTLSNPYHWQAVQAASKAAAITGGAVLAARALGITPAVTAATTAPAAATAPGPLRAAMGAFPKFVSQLRAATIPAAGSGSLGSGIVPAARAIVDQVRTLITVQRLRPVPYLRSRQEPVSAGPVHAALKGGLLPLPARPHHRQAVDGLAATHTALLPSATLQAAVTPEGPAPTAIVPRRRLFPMLRPRAPAPATTGEPRLALSWVGADTGRRPTLFQLACAPLSWLGVTTFRPPAATASPAPAESVIVPRSMWRRVKPVVLPPVTAGNELESPTTSTSLGGTVQPLVQPLDVPMSPLVRTWRTLSSPRFTWLRFPSRKGPSLAQATITEVVDESPAEEAEEEDGAGERKLARTLSEAAAAERRATAASRWHKAVSTLKKQKRTWSRTASSSARYLAPLVAVMPLVAVHMSQTSQGGTYWG